MKTLEQLAEECGAFMIHSGGYGLMGNESLARFRAACRAEALEEAAQRCVSYANEHADKWGDDEAKSRAWMMVQCAAAIREMK